MAVTPTYVPLGTITLASTDSEIVFSSIPATYRDLIVVANGTVSATDNVFIEANSDSTSNYPSVFMFFDGSVGSGTSTGTGLRVGRWTTSASMFIAQIMDYSATDKHKTSLSRSGSPTGIINAYAARWQDTSAITSLKIKHSGLFQIGSTFSLYGVN